MSHPTECPKCNEALVNKISSSEKNPNRIYRICENEQCPGRTINSKTGNINSVFMWLDVPYTPPPPTKQQQQQQPPPDKKILAPPSFVRPDILASSHSGIGESRKRVKPSDSIQKFDSFGGSGKSVHSDQCLLTMKNVYQLGDIVLEMRENLQTCFNDLTDKCEMTFSTIEEKLSRIESTLERNGLLESRFVNPR